MRLSHTELHRTDRIGWLRAPDNGLKFRYSTLEFDGHVHRKQGKL